MGTSEETSNTVPVGDEDQTVDDHTNHPRTRNSNEHHQQRRNDYNNRYGQSPTQQQQQHQGQSSPYNNSQERTFFNRGRNGAYEQVILIRGNCVARIVGKL